MTKCGPGSARATGLNTQAKALPRATAGNLLTFIAALFASLMSAAGLALGQEATDPFVVINFDDINAMPVYFEPSHAKANGSPVFFLWPSEEKVDSATQKLIGEPREQYDEDLVLQQLLLRQPETRRYSSTLKEMMLAPLSVKAMLEPDLDILGIPASCHGKASFSGAYAGCKLSW